MQTGEEPASPTPSPTPESMDEVSTRCTKLKNSITFVVFDNVRRGLLQQHKLLVAFLSCCKVRGQGAEAVGGGKSWC